MKRNDFHRNNGMTKKKKPSPTCVARFAVEILKRKTPALAGRRELGARVYCVSSPGITCFFVKTFYFFFLNIIFPGQNTEQTGLGFSSLSKNNLSLFIYFLFFHYAYFSLLATSFLLLLFSSKL